MSILNLELSYLSLLLTAVAVAIALYATTRWRLRHIRPQAGPGALLLWCGAFWILSNAFEMASQDLSSAAFWNRVQYIGIAPISVLWLLLALMFSGQQHLLTRARLVLLSAPLALCLAMALTNDHHGLFMSNVRAEIKGTATAVYSDPGLFMTVLYVYGYTLILVGTYLLTRHIRASTQFRWQGSLVLLAVALTIGANLVDLYRLAPESTVRFTPIALVFSIPLCVVTLIRARRADIVPTARSSVHQLMQDAVLVLDFENRIIDMNPAAEGVVGRPSADVMGKIISEAWPIWDRQMGPLAAGQKEPREIRIGEGSEERIFDVRVTRLTDWRDQLVSHVIVLRDITERVKMEEALRLSEQHFRALTENASDMVVVVDSMATICYASPSIERRFGFRLSEVIGKSAADFVHPEDLHCMMTALADSIESPGIARPIVARFRGAGGGWRKLECVANNLLDHPAVQGIVVNARDVTEREAVAEALRQSEEKYRLHFAHVSDVVYSFDSQLRLLTVTPSIERHLGIKAEEVMGRSILELGVLPPEQMERAACEAARVLSGERVEGAVYELVARDGTRRIAEVSANPVFHNGEVISVINVARDITERVRMDEHIRASLAEKEVLLKEIHHRVKNNLQIISSLLSLQSSSLDDGRVVALFDDSQHRIRSMALIHERLYRTQDLARIEFGPYLRDLTGHLLASYRVQRHHLHLSVEADDDLYLDIDTAVPCGLLVNELASNALKHAFPGERGGAIRVEMRQTEPGQYRLLVQDDGVGFPPELDFQQTTSLGLQLVSSLVQQLGGVIALDSSSSRGTTVDICFTRTLPLAAGRL